MSVLGRLSGPAIGGRGTLRVERGLPGGCRGEIAVVLPSDGAADADADADGFALARSDEGDGFRGGPPSGSRLRVHGRWLASPGAEVAAWSGTLRVEEWSVDPGAGTAPLAALRGRATARLHRSFGARGPLAAALVLSRKEGLDPALRDAFARAGVAHLLAISGFHVGVVAGLLLALFAALRLPRAPADLLAAVGAWGYVGLIGAPDAAVRAALLLSLVALARRVGRPLASEGALAAAFLVLASLDPGAPGRPGFQLSFAGAAGLARLSPTIDARMRRALPRLPAALRRGIAAGAGATAATLPVVAWHFERVSLVGIPATLVAGPLVALAIPGLLLVLLVGPVWAGLAAFLVGGVDLVLLALVRGVDLLAAPPWASVTVGRGWVLTATVGAVGAWLCIWGAHGLGRAARRAVLFAGVGGALLLAPVAVAWTDRGSVMIEALDVGQGDAILLRSPRRRWVLVDAGPRAGGRDAGLRTVLPALRRRGVRRLEALVLTHPDLDHVGGAAAVLRGVDVGFVLDPGRARGTDAFVEALEAAGERHVPWATAATEGVLRLDGMELRVLHTGGTEGPDVDPNDLSVVLLLRLGTFSALLTGDAPSGVEEAVAGIAGPVQLLKVAHHGSSTSSSAAFLARVRPTVALVSVGRRNRYGHPSPDVVARLRGVGALVLRTDLRGTVRVRGREDGSWTASAERPAN